MSKSIDEKQVNHDKAVKAAPTLAKIITDASTLNHVVVNIGDAKGAYKAGKSDQRLLPSQVLGPANHDANKTKTKFTVSIAGSTQLSHLFDVIANAICIMEHGSENKKGLWVGSKKGEYKKELAGIKADLENYRERIQDCGMNQLKLKETESKGKSEFLNTIAYSNGNDTQRVKVQFVTMISRDNEGKVAYHKDGSIKYEIAPSITLGDKVFTVNLEEATRAAQEVIIKNAIQEVKTVAKHEAAIAKQVAKEEQKAIKENAQNQIEELKLASVG